MPIRESQGCANFVSGYPKGKRFFCRKCRSLHSHSALDVQVEHNLSIQEILIDATIFRSAEGMAAYIGVTFPTIYKWIKKYFNLSFPEFKRRYICKSNSCYILNIERSSYTRNDYVLKKIRSKRYCACINVLDKDCIMTNAPISLVSSILRGCPRIEKISDNTFALAPDPIRFDHYPIPIRFNYVGKIPRSDIKPIRFEV